MIIVKRVQLITLCFWFSALMFSMWMGLKSLVWVVSTSSQSFPRHVCVGSLNVDLLLMLLLLLLALCSWPGLLTA